MLRQAVKRVLSRGMGWRLSAPLRPGGVVVLMYHRITRDEELFSGMPLERFADQMRWLRAYCEPIAPEGFLEATNHPERGRPRVLVTFDDGYRDYHDNAYPVLAELGIPSVVFLATAFMDTNRLIWTEAVSWAFVRTRRTEVSLPWARDTVLSLDGGQARTRAALLAKQHLKGVTDAVRQGEQARLFEALGVDPERDQTSRQMLSWDEVRATLGITRYGGHTHTHPILSQLPPEQVDEEIRTCRDRIESETGIAPRFFAYPNGRAQDFNAGTQDCLRRHGFDLGFSTMEGVNGPSTDPFAILRQPTGSSSIADFAWLVAGR